MVVVPFLVETPRVQRMSAERTLASLGLVLKLQMIPIGKRSSKYIKIWHFPRLPFSVLIKPFLRPTNTFSHRFSIYLSFIPYPVLGFLSR